ncbi:hypothetical protein [Rhodospirillum sp. A1_3_36]|uniref:hypothetical protein n=1 Tax=Rhodospirillum sp. A1_3_36 TaxID=3391666 RepID=UPI0039A485B8
MDEPEISLSRVTPELRAFLRSELIHVTVFDAPTGGKWTPHGIAHEINVADDIPGQASDDTISRFLNTPGYRIGKRALTAIAGFLLAFGFITRTDLDHHATGGYDRAASALSQLFMRTSGPEGIQGMPGAYHAYEPVSRDRLMEIIVTLASPDHGGCLVVRERRSVFRLSDPAYVIAETDGFAPAFHHRLPGLLEEPDAICEETGLGRGAGTITRSLALLLIGGEEDPAHGVVIVNELHTDKAGVVGFRAHRSSGWIHVRDGQTPRDPPSMGYLLGRKNGKHEFYRIDRKVGNMAKIASDEDFLYDEEIRGKDFLFQSMSEEKQNGIDAWHALAEDGEARFLTALEPCPDATSRLILSMAAHRFDHAIAAVHEGADVNAMFAEGGGIPVVHTAAYRGMRNLVKATGKDPRRPSVQGNGRRTIS